MDDRGGDGIFNPMYRELVKKIGDDIREKGLHDGDFYCTLKTICERYRVSITTARKAVSCMVHSRVLSCKSSRGIFIHSTFPLKIANTLVNAILIFDDHSCYSSYFSLRLGAVLREFSAVGYTTQVIMDNSLTPEMLEMAATSMIAVVFNRSAAVRLERFIRSSHRCPILLEHYMPQYENTANVIMVKKDTDSEIRLTLDFLRRGKQGVVPVFFEKHAYAPFREAFRQAGLIRDEVELESGSVAVGRAAVDRLAGYPKGTCFWIQDDFSAFGVLEGFLERGRDLRAEQTILVSGNPKFDYTSAMELPIIGFDPVCWGQRAAHELCRHLKTGTGNRLVDIPVETNFDHGDPDRI